MRISPNYNHEHICHFCHKNVAIKDNEIYRNLYYIEKATHCVGVYHSARYYKLTVIVPTCKECNKMNVKISGICSLICLCIFLVSTYIWSGIFAETNQSARSFNDILIACLPSLVITPLIGTPISIIVRLCLEHIWKSNSNCDDYPPIKKLVEIGFEPRDSSPNLKSRNLQGKGPLKMSELRKAITDIVTNEHCIFKNDQN